MNWEELETNELRQGWRHNKAAGRYECAHCHASFEEGEVFEQDGRFFTAARAAARHVQAAHPARFEELLALKENALTQNQRALLAQIRAGQSDRDIAAAMEVSASTVRHQRYVFREKAKAARLYLALYEMAFEDTLPAAAPAHSEAVARMYARYGVQPGEEAVILKGVFYSLQPLKLRSFPRKDKKKAVILGQLAHLFTPGRRYTGKEVDATLAEIYEDTATLRRYMVDWGLMERTRNGSEYWLV